MKRVMRWAAPVTLLSYANCLPDDFFPNLLGSSIAAVTGVVLSDFLNTFFPAP